MHIRLSLTSDWARRHKDLFKLHPNGVTVMQFSSWPMWSSTVRAKTTDALSGMMGCDGQTRMWNQSDFHMVITSELRFHQLIGLFAPLYKWSDGLKVDIMMRKFCISLLNMKLLRVIHLLFWTKMKCVLLQHPTWNNWRSRMILFMTCNIAQCF